MEIRLQINSRYMQICSRRNLVNRVRPTCSNLLVICNTVNKWHPANSSNLCWHLVNYNSLWWQATSSLSNLPDNPFHMAVTPPCSQLPTNQITSLSYRQAISPIFLSRLIPTSNSLESWPFLAISAVKTQSRLVESIGSILIQDSKAVVRKSVTHAIGVIWWMEMM